MNTNCKVNDDRARFINSVTPQSSPYLVRKPQGTKENVELGSMYEHHEPSTCLSWLVTEGNIEKLRVYSGIESELELLDDSGLAVLHYAAKLNRVEILMFLLDSGANIDARSTDNMTPLHIACKYGSEQAVPVLLRRGADPTLKTNHGHTALHFAAQKGNVSIVETLLQNKNVMVNAQNVRGYTPLHDACKRKRFQVSALLIKYEAAIDARTVEEMTPLHIAAFLGDVNMLQLLLDKAVEQRSNIRKLLESGDNKSVLRAAVMGGSPEALNLIVQQGVNVKQSKPRTYAPLHCAAVMADPESIMCLLSKGADVKIRDESLKTPLHWASSLNRTTPIKIFLEAGAEHTARDSMGMTPFLSAVRAGHSESSQLLLESGADINATDSRSKSCLHLALEQENCEMVRFLLQHTGLELINMVDSRERTPLHYAALSKNSEILQTLIDKGCTCLVADENLKTPLHLAAEHGKLKNAQKLLNACMSMILHRDEMGRLALHYAAMNGRSKICALLLGCPTQANTVDIDNWSPLLWASKSGSVDCVEMLLHKGASAESRDSKGNTALHVAVIHGHAKVVLCLLDHGAPILINHEGLNCLDYAIENHLHDGVRIMVQHKRWREFFEARGKNSQNLLGKLIERCPAAAEVVLENCVERSPNPRAFDYTVRYNFRLLDPGPLDVSSKDGTRFFGLSELVRHRREHLIQHPVASKMLDTKWKNFGLPLYFVNFITYLCFVILLTVFMQTQRQNTSLLQQGSMRTEGDFRITSSFNRAINKAGMVFVVFHMCKELCQIYMLKLKYFFSFQNLIEWAIYITGFLFLIAFATNSEVLMATNLPWQCGTTCIFLSYMNLIYQTRLIWYIGLYVTMFTEVFKTLMQVMSMVAMFIIAYAVVFFLLFKEQASFADFGRSIVKTTVMTIGELNYDELLVSNLYESTNKTGIPSPLVPFPIISNIFFYAFMLTMPIVIMNLLVGLAVGDIDAIRKTSNLRRKAAMIEFLKETESRYPASITQYLYKSEIVEKPNCTVINRWKFFFGGRWKDAFDDEQEHILNKELKGRYERLDKCVYKTKRRVKAISTLLEKQNRMLVALTTKQNLCQDEYEETTKLLWDHN